MFNKTTFPSTAVSLLPPLRRIPENDGEQKNQNKFGKPELREKYIESITILEA